MEVVQYVYDAYGNHKIFIYDYDKYIDISDQVWYNGDNQSGTSGGVDFDNHPNARLALANPFRYRGYYYDQETNLYYLMSRYYDPETGRFINADDISYLDPETVCGLNLYAYCGGNPVMMIDSGGCEPTPWWVKLFIGIGIVVGTALFALAVVASAGTVGALAGIGVAAIGFSAGTVAAVATTATIITYGIAVGIGLVGLSDAVEVWSDGTNPIRDWLMGGNQMAYDVTRGVLHGLGTLATVVGAFGPKIMQKIAGKFGNPVYNKTGKLMGHKLDFSGKNGWNARIDATTHGYKGHNNPHLHLLHRDVKQGGISKNIYYFWQIIKGWFMR